MLQIPAGKWNLLINEDGKIYGQLGRENGSYLSLTLSKASGVLFTYNEISHLLSISTATLESRSQPPGSITLTLDDTLIFDGNGNMIANPVDSIRYTMILKNQSGQSMLNAIITHTGDPNVTIDSNSVKASPLAFNDTIDYDVHPKTLIAPGILANDFDLNDVLPNPPNYTNLSVIRVNSLASNVGVSFVTTGGGTVTVNANGSITYDSTGVNGALTDIIYYTILDQDGFEDSASILIQFNAPPVISSNLAVTDTICAFEQRDTFIMTPAFTISDDELNEESAKIQICTNYLSTEDTLIAGALPGGISAVWIDGTGTLMLMGSASLADYETAIESIQYTNQSDHPNTFIREICITVNDWILNSNQVTRLLKVKPVNDCPTAVRDSISILENGPIPVYSVLTNDIDPDLDVLSVSKINGGATLTGVVIHGGTVSLNGTTGAISFAHTTGFSGLDSLSAGELFFARFAYSATDGLCEDTDSVIIKITGVNDAPLISTNLLATDSICAFEQQDTFIVTSAFTLADDEDNEDSASIQICSNYLSSEDTLIAGILPGGILATWNDATGTLTLKGNTTKANYETAIENIQYTNQSNTTNTNTRLICITVNDGDLTSNQVTRELKIKPVNDCPVAVRDTFLVNENAAFPLSNVLTNDTDPENDPLTATPVVNASIGGGTVNLLSNGTFIFAHTTGAFGLDTLNVGEMYFARLSYSVSDGQCTDADSIIIKVTGVNDAPTADSNAFNATQTAILSVTAPGILSDDNDIDHSSTITVGTVNGSAANVGMSITLPSGALLTVNADGSFSYNTNCQAGGIDSFNYQAIDEHMALSNTVKVYITIAQSIWFVDGSVAMTGNGSFSLPFKMLAEAQAASVAGQIIFVFPGTYNENLTLKNNQSLIGADENWLCPEGGTIRVASGMSTINGTLTLAQNNTIKGIEFGNSTAAVPMILDNGGTVGNLLISNTTINTTTSGGLKISNGGALNVSFDSFNSTSPSEAFNLNNCTGNLLVSAGNINPSIGSGDTMIAILAGTITANINASLSQPNNFPLTYIGSGHTTGIVTFQTGTLSASSGTGIQFNDADGTYNFNGNTTLNGGDAGIDIVNSSSGTFAFSVNTGITNPTNNLINVNGSTANVTYSGSFTKNNNSVAGINIVSNTGGTIHINGFSTKSISVGSANAVNLNTNTGTTINFSNGGLVVATSSGIAFQATGGGTVNVTGTGNTLTSTTGTALNVNATTIGASNLNFQSISSNGSSNGISLNNTGASGGLVVTGDGGNSNNSSGGTIQNTSGAGISLVNTRNIVLDQMNIQNTVGSGIKGTTVVGFTCTNSMINNSATGAGVDESNIAFNSSAAGTEQNLSGTVMITGNTLTNAVFHGIDIMNFNGTISNITLSNNTITSTTSTVTSKGSGMRVQALGSASTVANITKASVTNNTITNFPGGNGILFQGGNGNAAGTGATLGTPGSLSDIILITSNRIAGQSSAILLGSNGIVTAVSGKGQGNFDISNNGTVANPITNVAGSGVACSAFGQVTVTAVINNNVIVAHNIVASRGIAAGVDMVFGVSDAPNMTLTISNNNVSQCDGNGIFAGALNSNGTARIKILNNTIAAPLSGNREGIRVNSGTPSAPGTNTTVCLNISGNTSAGSGLATGIGLRKEGTVSSTNAFSINGMMATASPGVESYVDGLNPAGNGTTLNSATSGFTNCSFP